MKKILFITIPALLIAISIYLLILHLNNLNSQKGALQVTSSPVCKVYLDDKYIGRTPVSKTEAADMIRAGNYTIKLVPEDSSLSEYQEKITISAGILTVVDRKFNKGSISEGYVITLTALNDKNSTQLETISIPAGSNIDLDANSIGKTPLLYKNPTESDHILNISKEGYNDKTIRIRTPKGYRLTVIAYLGIGAGQPKISTQPSPSASPSASISITPSPSAGLTEAKVLILDTPTGFLRVRENGNINSPQKTTVNPGEIYPLLNEEPGWYEIKISNTQTGWISSDYAQKQ